MENRAQHCNILRSIYCWFSARPGLRHRKEPVPYGWHPPGSSDPVPRFGQQCLLQIRISGWRTAQWLVLLSKYRIVVFCDSDFWHGYDWDNRKSRIKSNQEYWIPKIERNMKRDKEVTAVLVEQGWIVLRFWEHSIRKNLECCLDDIEDAVFIRKELMK